jgi:hypothetical protein
MSSDRELEKYYLQESLEWALSKIEFPLVPDREYKTMATGCPGCRVLWVRDMVHAEDCQYIAAKELC